LFEADPLAILAVSIGIRRIADEEAGRWIVDIATRAMEGETDAWRVGLLAAAAKLGGAEPSGPQPPELAVVIASRLGVPFDQKTADRALSASLALDEPTPEQAAVRLAALRALASGGSAAGLGVVPSSTPRGSGIDAGLLELQEVKGKVDFAIITIREDELRAVLDRFPGETVESQNRFYRLSRVPVGNGSTALVAIARAFEQGTGEAQTVARHIIDDMEPHWILVVGIAGGVPDSEYTLGDVVLSTRVNDLTVHAKHETAPDQFAISGGPSSYAVTKLITALPMLESKLQGWNTRDSIGRARPPVDWSKPESFYGDEKWQGRVLDSLKHHFGLSAAPREPMVRAGPIDSSDGLIKDTKTLQQWLTLTRNALAVEMEAGGVYRAVRSGGREYPFLSIRGLSDIVGFKRHPDWTAYACHSAAAFTLALIKSALVKRREEAATNP
jgi:nucleoside phosphorylase